MAHVIIRGRHWGGRFTYGNSLATPFCCKPKTAKKKSLLKKKFHGADFKFTHTGPKFSKELGSWTKWDEDRTKLKEAFGL